ncbi:MAG TPA: Ig-like domain-containing protein, partial [Coriobacteriia bacterium]
MRARRWAPVVAVVAGCAVAASLFASGVASAGVQPVSIGAVRPESPAVSGGRLVWADRRTSRYDIYLYDVITRATRCLTSGAADHVQPAISGDLVVWADYRNGDSDIYAYDLATGTERPLVVAPGDQIAPSVSGRWLVWEDRGSGYSGSVNALDLSVPGSFPIRVATNARRPQVAGDLVVWESTSKSAPDIRAHNLSTGVDYDVATGPGAEMLPATDGRYVAWAQDNGVDLDIRAFDTATSSYVTCAASSGEQSFPAVGNGVVYWVDNSPGQRLHVDTYDMVSGRSARFNDYGTEDVAAVAASGGDVGWLAKSGTSWRLRGAFSTGGLVTAALQRLAPVFSTSAPLAQLAADPAPPTVVSTSIQRGARRVARDASFSVYFSKPLDPSTVGGNAVRLLDSRGRPVRGRVRYSALAKAITVTPSAPLDAGTYTLSVSPAIADPSGNTLESPLAVSFSTIDILADTSPPTMPGNLVTKVYQGNQVSLSWRASSDNVAVQDYYIYRSASAGIPITAFPAGASFVASTTATTATVNLAADEKAKSFTYYYVVVARDTSLNQSAPSYNDAPDPHGTFTASRSTNLCQRCHAVHGGPAGSMALNAKSASACYVCHGSTPATAAYGAASSMDAQADFRDDTVIAATGPEISGRGSIHRNAYMATIQRECDACHTPHKKSYDVTATNSYNRLLRTQLSTSPAGYDYNTDAVAIGNQFCTDCHGASSTNIAIIGGDTAYSNTGGNHVSDYGSSAHATASVAVNAGDTNPSIQCEACHNNHAAGATKLIDYRLSATSTAAYDQSGLCFACHSTQAFPAGQETGKPNTWNGRDVKAEFARSSHHPYSVGGGQWVPQTGKQVFSQTAKAEFDTDTLFQTMTNLSDVPDANGAAVLATHTTTVDPPLGPYLFFADPLPRFDSLSPASTVWNEDFTPTNITAPATGANSTVK